MGHKKARGYTQGNPDYCRQCLEKWPCEFKRWKDRALDAEAALQRVTTLCDLAQSNPHMTMMIAPGRVRAAIKGEDT